MTTREARDAQRLKARRAQAVDEWFGRRGKDGVRRWGLLERDTRRRWAADRADQRAQELAWEQDASTLPAESAELAARLDQLEATLERIAAERREHAELMAQEDEANARAAKRPSGAPGTDDGDAPEPAVGMASRLARDEHGGVLDRHRDEGGDLTVFRPRIPRERSHTYEKQDQGRPCAEPGCQNPVIGTASKRYCAAHSTRAAVAKRAREQRRRAA